VWRLRTFVAQSQLVSKRSAGVGVVKIFYDSDSSGWKSFRLHSPGFNSTHMSCNLIEFCTDFLPWFKTNSFAYFSSLPRRSNISIRNTLERIHESYSFSENDLKREITLAKTLLRKESKLRISLEQFLLFVDT